MENRNTVINFSITKEKLVELINFIRTIPKHDFDAAELADRMIRKYFKELQQWN